MIKLIKIINEAYSLYMPQVEYEIEELTKFLVNAKGVNDWNILEIGSKFGGTFHIWNSINPNGLNISIDMSDGGIHGGISGEEMDKRDELFKSKFSNCHFIRGDSHTWSTHNKFSAILNPKKEFESTNKFKQLDFLFIDGDHSHKGVKQDFEMYSHFVKKGGCIAFHDIIISDRHHERDVYVGEFWNEIKNDERFGSFEFIGDPNQDWAGIGVLIKK